jgi:bifunctional DNase/RNase
MKLSSKLGLAGLLLMILGFFAISKETSPLFIEMEVKGVRLDALGQNSVVFLADKKTERVLPIWIGPLEAHAIDRELNHITPPRPLTHDLLHSILGQVHANVKEVRIIELKEHTYYAILFLTLEKQVMEIDARPSDAIILALKSKTPILVSSKILDEQGIAMTEKKAFAERHGIRIQELTPSLASHFNFKGGKGVLVSEVLAGSPSEVSGMKAGDILVRIGQREVGSVHEFEETLDAIKGETKLRIIFFRDDQLREVELTLKP